MGFLHRDVQTLQPWVKNMTYTYIKDYTTMRRILILISASSLAFKWGFFKENKLKLVFGALSLQGSYLHFYCSKFKKLHEIWKGFFNAVNLRPTATFSLYLFRSYGSIKATMKSAQFGSWRKKTLLTCGHKNSSVFNQFSKTTWGLERIFQCR